MRHGCHHATWIRAIIFSLNHLFWINLTSYHIPYMLSYIAWFRAIFVLRLLAASMTNSSNYSGIKYCLLCFQTHMSCPNHFAAQMSSGAAYLRMLVNQGLPQFIFHGYFSMCYIYSSIYVSLNNHPGARFTYDFLPAIQIRWKLRLVITPLLAIRSQQIFAHATTAQLSCHVQNFVAITVLELRWEWNENSIEFELR